MFLVYKVLVGSYDARKYAVMSPKVILSRPPPAVSLKYTYGSLLRCDTASSFRRLTADDGEREGIFTTASLSGNFTPRVRSAVDSLICKINASLLPRRVYLLTHLRYVGCAKALPTIYARSPI